MHGLKYYRPLIALAFASLSARAAAQSPAATPDTASTPPRAASVELGEVIVTAQRRAERLSRTPVAVTSISGDTLARAAIKTQADLQIAAPGLVVKASTNSNDLNYAIRGQSLDAYSGTRPGVLPYFNEVQVGGQGTASSFYDLQSVQVLKGPQGTLFGRNSTGGAVLFTSTAPARDFGGYLNFAGGNYNTGNAEGALNVPLVADKLFARIAGVYQTNSGYQHNIFNGEDLGASDREGVRGSLTWKPTSKINNTLVVDYYHGRGTNMAPVLGSVNTKSLFPISSLYSNAMFPAGQAPASGPYVSDFVLSQILQQQGLSAASANAVANGNYARYIASFNNPNAVPIQGISKVLSDQQSRGPWQADSDNPNRFQTSNIVLTNATDFALGDHLNLKNIVGYTNLKSSSNVDYDGTPFLISDTGEGSSQKNTVNTTQVSEELQLSGRTGPLNFVTGGYFSHENTYNNLTSLNVDILLGGGRQYNVFQRISTTYAGYAQGTYDLREITGVQGLSLTLGARLSDEDVRNVILPGASQYPLQATDPTVYQNDQSHTFTNVSWTTGVQEQLNSNLLLYATSRRSYKNGGFNGTAAPKIGYGDVSGNAYQTEQLTDLELGTKYDGRIADMPLRVNLAAYNDWIDNNQRTAYVIAPSGLVAVSVNVPHAQVTGVELDGDISPFRWLQLGGSLNYTDGRFTNGLTQVAGTTADFETYPDTSRWSGVLFATATVPLTADLRGVIHGDVFAQTKQDYYSAVNLDPGATIPSYSLANFRVGVESNAGWSLTANIKNAFDRRYYVGGLPLGALVAVNTLIPGLPRTFLIQAAYKF